MSTQEQWSLITQCFPQDTLDVMETIAGEKRSEEDLPRAELRNLTLDEGQCAGRGIQLQQGRSPRQPRRKKTRIPLTREAAIEMTKQIRVIMSICPDTNSKNMDSVRMRMGIINASATRDG